MRFTQQYIEVAKKLIVVALSILVVIFVLNFLADNPYSHRLVRALINEKVRQESLVNIDFEAINISAIPLGADLFGFKVTPRTNVNQVLFKSSHIKVRISLWSIILGEPKLGLVEVHDLETRYPFPDGFEGFLPEEPDLKKTSKSEPIKWPIENISLPVETIALKNARIAATIPSESHALPALDLAIKSLDLTADVKDLSEIGIYILAKDINLSHEDLPILRDTEFETDVIISGKKIRKSPYRIKNRYLDFVGILSGSFKTDRQSILNRIDMNIDFAGQGDLGQLGQVFDIPDTRGPISGKGTTKLAIPVEGGRAFDLLVSAETKADGAQIQNFQLNQTEAVLEIDLDRLNVVEATIMVGKEEYGTAEGYLSFDAGTPFSFSGKPHNLPLKDLMRALTVEFAALNADLTSTNLKVYGQGKPLKMQVTAIADFDDLHAPALAKPTPSQDGFPTCRLAIDLAIDSDRLSFDNTSGSCFIHAPGSEKGIVPAETASPPKDALAISDIEISGSATFENQTGLDMFVRSKALHASLLDRVMKIQSSGIGTINLNAKGPYSDVVLTADTTVNDFFFFDINLGRASGRINLINNGSTIQWQNLRILFPNNGSIYSEKGQLDPTGAFRTQSDLAIANAPAQMVGQFFSLIDIPGPKFDIHSLDAKISGPLFQPLAYHGSIDFYLKGFSYNDIAEFDVISTTLMLDEQTISADNLNIELKDFQIRSQLQVNRSKPEPPQRQTGNLLSLLGIRSKDKIKLKSETYLSEKWREARKSPTFFFDHLQKLPFLKPYAKFGMIKGRLSGGAEMEGTFEELSGTFTAEVEETKLVGSAIAPIKVAGILQKNHLDLVVNHAGDSLEGRIGIDIAKPTYPFTWFLKAQRLDLRALGSQYFATDPRNYAYLSGGWQLNGELADWWNAKGKLEINDIRIRFYRDVRGESKTFELQDYKPVTVIMKESGWYFEGGKDLQMDSDSFGLHISLGESAPPENLDISFDGHIDLALLQNMYQQIEAAKGQVAFEGAIKGNVANPDFSLRIKNRDAIKEPITVGIAQIRPPFTNVNIDVSYAQRRLVLNSLTATKGKGSLSASGQISLDKEGEDDSRIDINLDNAALVYQVAILKSFESSLSGALSIAGNRAPFAVSGDVVVNRAWSTKEFDLREQIIGALQRRQLDQPLVPEAPTINLDLRISADNSVEIYNRTIQSLLSANILVKGNNVVPVINGQVEVNKGAFAYKYRRDFRVTQGLITFDDPVKPDPRLDILGVSEISGYRVYLAITGRASNPKVDLSIDPPAREDGTPLSKLDILVLMSTGSLPEQTQSNSATTAAQTEALNILVGQFEEPVERLFDLSGQTVVQRVYIDTYAGEDGPTPRLNLPLNLHQDWDVIFRVDENNQKVSLGYTINENISISGSVDSQRETQNTRLNQSQATQQGPDTGVDLRFRFAFP